MSKSSLVEGVALTLEFIPALVLAPAAPGPSAIERDSRGRPLRRRLSPARVCGTANTVMSGKLGFGRFKSDDEARSDRENTATAAPKSGGGGYGGDGGLVLAWRQ